ncbi:hypothetical protein SEA_SCENTAE_52 [Gordonia phage SCentae]|nr:hypothetical protein SEA_SCENTAE_52 [Gordonia phage SCentae]
MTNNTHSATRPVVRDASDPQIKFVRNLLAERDWKASDVATYRNRVDEIAVAISIADGAIEAPQGLVLTAPFIGGKINQVLHHLQVRPLTSKGVSPLIDWLQLQPRIQVRRSRAVEVTEEGFYLFDGAAYQVQLTKDRQRLYAKKATATGWDYESGRGVIFDLRPEHLMTPAQIAQFGKSTGFCVNCSHPLESKVSQGVGLGTKCGPAILGKEGYKAARQAVIDNDPEAAVEVQRAKDLAASRRKARKAQAQA